MLLLEVQGRALVKMKDVHITQCYLPTPCENDIDYAKSIGDIVTGIAERNTASKAAGIRVVSDVVVYDELIPFVNPQEKKAVLGFDTETTEPVYMDLPGGSQMIVGAPATGKTNILKLIALQFNGEMLFIADSRAGDLNKLDSLPNTTYMETESQFETFYDALNAEVETRQKEQEASGMRLREFCASKPPVLVLVDDCDNFIELCKSKAREMEALVPKAIEVGVSFVITTHPSKLRGYDNLTKIFRDAQMGLVLGNPGEQSLLQVTPPRGYKAVNDIGFWCKRGDVRQVKLPFVKEL